MQIGQMDNLIITDRQVERTALIFCQKSNGTITSLTSGMILIVKCALNSFVKDKSQIKLKNGTVTFPSLLQCTTLTLLNSDTALLFHISNTTFQMTRETGLTLRVLVLILREVWLKSTVTKKTKILSE